LAHELRKTPDMTKLKLISEPNDLPEMHKQPGDPTFKRAFVTGADDGFVGTELVRTLRRHNIKVVTLIKPQRSVDTLHQMGVVISRGDISNIENIASALIDCEVIFHTQFQDSGDLASMISHNVGGTTNLINAAKLAHCRRFVFLSTAEVTVGVGPNNIAVDETTTIKPELVQSNYGKSMAMAEVC